MKKKVLLIISILGMAFVTLNLNAQNGESILLQATIYDPTKPNGGFHKTPIQEPSVSLDDHTLYFDTPCDKTIIKGLVKCDSLFPVNNDGYIDPTKELRPHKNPIPMPEISLDNKSHVFTDFPVDTARLNTSYRELTSHPNTLQRQQAFFEAFPNNWNEFSSLYKYMPHDGYDLTMYHLAPHHIDALWSKVTLLKDSVYCRKLVNIAVGAQWDADAPNYFQDLLHKVVWKRMDGMLIAISILRKGHQMQFWQFYWSNSVKSDKLETEYRRLYKLNADKYPEQMKIMEIAFQHFYDGVNMGGR